MSVLLNSRKLIDIKLILHFQERECKELQKERDKKDEQLKAASLHIENKDAEICRLQTTNL